MALQGMTKPELDALKLRIEKEGCYFLAIAPRQERPFSDVNIASSLSLSFSAALSL